VKLATNTAKEESAVDQKRQLRERLGETTRERKRERERERESLEPIYKWSSCQPLDDRYTTRMLK
jgi:hypothetical protein